MCGRYPAKIEVDNMRLVENDSTTRVSILAEEHYDSAFPQILSLNQGALYDRSNISKAKLLCIVITAPSFVPQDLIE